MTLSDDHNLMETHQYGFLEVLRRIEREANDKPRIGANVRLRDELVALGQDPYLGFPISELSEVDVSKSPASVRPRFLGFFGPFGPLPLAMTREVDHWARHGDQAFVRFADIFTARFIELFYRTWSDSRPITQFDHPSDGSFPDILRAFTGDADDSYRDVSPIDDTVRLRYTALQTGRIKSPSKLRKLLEAHFGIDVRIEEFASSWLTFPPEERSQMGLTSMGLGQDAKLGDGTVTTNEKVIVHLNCQNNTEYQDFLPGQPKHAELCDLVTGYIGQFFLVDVQLWLPKSWVAPAKIGTSLELGWSGNLHLDRGTQSIENVLQTYLEYPAYLERTPVDRQSGKTRIPNGAENSDKWLLWGIIKLNNSAELYDHKLVIHLALNEDEADNFQPNSWLYDRFLSDVLSKLGRFERLEIVVLVPHEVEDPTGTKMVPRKIKPQFIEPDVVIQDDTFVQVCRYQIN